ncbi:MAG TPA: hypothetical protein DCM87_11840 [Planctomycetes bacterium]|nr:hypothetical protein [Planctomycetota bacterium]
MKPTRLTVFCTVAALFAAAPAFAGLIAHYEIQEDGTPLAIEDVSGNGRNAAFIDTQDPPAPLYVEGYPCTAGGTLQFNGTTQYVDASGHFGTGIYLNPAFTVALWVKGAPQADMRVFAEGSTANTTPLVTIGTRTATDGTAKFYIRGSATIERYSTRVAFDNTWHHIAWVDKRVAAGTNMLAQSFVYIDGVLDSTFTYVRPAFTGTNALNTTAIGAIKRATVGNRFTGAIDAVRVYDHALSPAEVSALVVPPCAGCPVEGDPDYYDTQITAVAVTGPAANAAGWYRITAAGTDGTGDALWYTIVASNPAWSEVWAAAGAGGTLDALLRAGEWTITVMAVDSKPLCKDGALNVQTITVTEEPMLVAHFPFNGDVADASGNANDGTFVTVNEPLTPTFVEGFDGTPSGAILFDGVDDYVNVLQARGLPLSMHEDLTVAFWMKGLPQVDKRMFSEGTTTSNTPLYNVGTFNTATNLVGKADIFIRSLGASYGHAYSDRLVLDDAWHHVAWVDKNGAGVLYIDGIRDAAVFSYDRAVMGPLTMNRTSIGAILRAAPATWFMGAIDDVRLYNYALSAEEVLGIIPEPEDCPDAGDTHCQGLTYVGPEGGVEGVYTFTCNAVDDSGDPMFYTFILRDGLGKFLRQVGPQALESVDFTLAPGTWTVDVEVDDSIWCRDRAEDAGCATTVVVRTEPPILFTHLTLNGDLVDSGPGGNNGTAIEAVAVDTTWEVVEVEPDFNEGIDCASPGALEFFGDAAPGMVRLAHTSHMPITSKSTFTIAAWVKGLPQSDRRVFALSSTTNNNGLFNLGTHNAAADGTLDFYLRDDNNVTVTNHAHSTGVVFDGTWHHFAWTDDGGQVVLYIDGQPDATNFSYTRPAVFAPDTTTLGGILRMARLAADPPANPMTSFFSGMIDDVRLYNYVLAPAEVAGLVAMRPEHCCPVNGDTHCTKIEVAGGPLAGPYTVTATGSDDSRDAVLYTFKADNGTGTVLAPVSQAGNVATFDLTPGTWTISATADDDPLCDDVAADATCTAEVTVLRCPIDGDTHCQGVVVVGGPLEGPYTATCTAVDDSGDAILYAFKADNGAGTVLDPTSQEDNVAVFDLTEGVWTITVTVDDDPTCDDAAPDAACSTGVIVVRCPAEGDTHCGGLSVEGGPGEGPYTATCTATDDSGDAIIYTFTAEDGAGTVLGPSSQADNVATFELTEGTWTIAVTVDDDPACDDQADDAVCTAQVTVAGGVKFKRGDANADGKLDIADAIKVLGYLFGGGTTTLACRDAGDGNDDGKLDIADAIKILGHLFAQTGPLPEPFAECGVDPTDTDPDVLDCESFPPCEL